jgi:hypothetical protein
MGSWEAALDGCEELDWGGHSDWRLPSATELLSIVDYRLGGPSIDPTMFPSTPWDLFWSASSVPASPTTAAIVSFGSGPIGLSGKASPPYNTRCVRGEPGK